MQIISELKLWQKNLGLLINFGRPKVEFKRIPFNEKEKQIIEDYSEIKNKIDDSTRQFLTQTREAIHFIFEMHGLGFGRVVYSKIFKTELKFRGIAYHDKITMPVKYNRKLIRDCKVKAIGISKHILCGITAIQDQITAYDALRMKTYLKYSNHTIGLLINFGKSNLQIRAISH